MKQSIETIVQQLYDQQIEAGISRPEEQFGDYATNVALQLAKPLGRSPHGIAEEIAAKLRETNEFSDVSVAGPGFINLKLTDESLWNAATTLMTNERSEDAVVVETNNPNPFKAMHIGHAFNATLGDTVANLLDLRYSHVYRVSYHGDIGLHVGKSMYALLMYANGSIEQLTAIAEPERNSFMSKMYAEGSMAYNEDEQAKAEINSLAEQSFAPTDALYAQIYELCKAWSFQGIDQIVSRLGNKPTVYRFLESDADARGVATVKANTPAVFKQSDGAYIFEGSKYGSFDNVFVAGNGRGLYGARDLGLMQLKNEQFHPKKSYIITAEEQRDYFNGVIAAANLALPELKDVTVNVSTGTVKLTTGKMSSRSGDVVEISWLFDEFKQAIEARGGVGSDEIVAGALRYQFLKVKIGSDVVFDVNEAVSLSGNTGSYLQYAHARARSILAKSSIAALDGAAEYDTSERTLVRKLGEFAPTIEQAAEDLAPHMICTYLYELAQAFNRFYESSRIIGDEREAARLTITRMYADTLARGLGVLGIVAPEKM